MRTTPLELLVNRGQRIEMNIGAVRIASFQGMSAVSRCPRVVSNEFDTRDDSGHAQLSRY